MDGTLTVETAVKRTPRFAKDCKHYVLSDAEADAISNSLRENPSQGKPLPGEHRLRCMTFRTYLVIFCVADDFSTVFLLKLHPKRLDIPDLSETSLRALDILHKMRALFIG